MANITKINVNGTVYDVRDSYAVAKKNSAYAYRDLASYYSAGTTPTYIRIKLPQGSATWAMLSLEISLKQNYSSGYNGKILFYGNWSSSAEFNSLNAQVYGSLTTGIKLYTSDKQYVYIGGCSNYVTCAVDRLLAGDNITGYDLSGVIIDYVTALPATYQTVTMSYGLTSSNYSSWVAAKDHTHSGYAASSHTHTSVIDAGNNSSATTFAYSKSGLDYSGYTWLAGWNGYELRAINKSQFAKADHTHTGLGSVTLKTWS